MNQDLLIAKIEDLSLSAFGRWQLLLVYLDQKPACLTEIKSGYYRANQSVKSINQIELTEIKQVLTELGLAFELGSVVENEVYSGRLSSRLVQTQMLYVAKDQLILKKLTKAHQAQPIDHQQLGKLLGYPASAVEAFVKQTVIKNDQINQPKYRQLARFAGFRLSPNYQRELALVQKWLEATQEASPLIIKDIWRRIYGTAKEVKWK